MFNASNKYHMSFSHCCFPHIWGITVFLFGEENSELRSLFGYICKVPFADPHWKNEHIEVTAVPPNKCLICNLSFPFIPKAPGQPRHKGKKEAGRAPLRISIRWVPTWPMCKKVSAFGTALQKVFRIKPRSTK